MVGTRPPVGANLGRHAHIAVGADLPWSARSRSDGGRSLRLNITNPSSAINAVRYGNPPGPAPHWPLHGLHASPAGTSSSARCSAPHDPGHGCARRCETIAALVTWPRASTFRLAITLPCTPLRSAAAGRSAVARQRARSRLRTAGSPCAGCRPLRPGVPQAADVGDRRLLGRGQHALADRCRRHVFLVRVTQPGSAAANIATISAIHIQGDVGLCCSLASCCCCGE